MLICGHKATKEIIVDDTSFVKMKKEVLKNKLRPVGIFFFIL